MNQPIPSSSSPSGPELELELHQLSQRVDTMRAVLVGLLQDVVRAESFLDHNQSVQLLEANEQLLLSSLRAQADSQSALQALDEAARTVGLDPLTKLANRTLALDRLKHAITHAERQGTWLAVLFVDLDKFKQINDSFGHAVGDQVLRHVAQCLLATVRQSDTVSRHGGDEFLILLDKLAKIEDALVIAEKIKEALQMSGGEEKSFEDLSASIGISIFPRDAETAGDLIACADQAMYMAKRQGPGGISFFVDDTDPLDLSPRQVMDATPKQAPQERSQTMAQQLKRQAKELELLREAHQQLLLSLESNWGPQTAVQSQATRQAELLVNISAELNDPHSAIRMAMVALDRAQDEGPLTPRARAKLQQQTLDLRELINALLHPIQKQA